LGTFVLGVTSILVLALQTLARANLERCSMGARRALINFDTANMKKDGIAQDRIPAEIGDFVRKSLHAKEIATLPLVPDAYTLEFEGQRAWQSLPTLIACSTQTLDHVGATRLRGPPAAGRAD